MKPKKTTSIAERSIRDIATYINSSNPAAAHRFLEAAYQTIEDFDERFLPRRASPSLPDYVREQTISGFKGYTLRVAVLDDQVVFLAAFAPGLSAKRKNQRTKSGLGEA